MMRAMLPNAIEIEYETFGSADDPALLLVMGLGAQLIAWDERFCHMLASGGRYVIRFDNRDVGLSTKFDGAHVDVASVLAARVSGATIPDVPYVLADMAADAIALLDYLNIDRAHVAGASMGGMIVQTLAIKFPERLLSATSIMSTPGDSEYGRATPEALSMLLGPPPTDRNDAIERAASYSVIASKRYFDLERSERFAAMSFDRSFYPEGVARQLAAIFASGDRSDDLRNVDVPMLVIHGLDDTLIDPSGGRRTAQLVPGAHLLELADMGHDMPEPLWPLVVAAITGHGDMAAATRDPVSVRS